MEKISIVIPVFNEETHIERTIHQLDEIIRAHENDFDVIFVNDGSTDKTEQVLNGLNADFFHVIHHDMNRGYGAALKTGIAHSSSPYICIADADGTYPLDEIPRLAKALSEGYDMVVGARSGKRVKIPFLRRLPKWILNKFCNYLSGFKIPDINSGLRIMRKTSVERFNSILPNGFSFTTTITIAMLTNNMKVHFSPINYFVRHGKSKIRPFYDTFNFLQLIIRTSLYFNPLKVFIPISMFFFCGAFLVLALSWMFLDKIMDVTFGVFIMTSVMTLSIGMLADLIDKRL
ncbi:MAG: glycosyltransferase family 2 protein [Desulfobacterales bacterium]